MHEKAKKKTSEKYSVQQLLEKVTVIRDPQQQNYLQFESICDELLYF